MCMMLVVVSQCLQATRVAMRLKVREKGNPDLAIRQQALGTPTREGVDGACWPVGP